MSTTISDAAFVDKPDAPAARLGNWSRSGYINGTFRATDFPIPADGGEGNIGRNTYRGPGFAEMDFSVIKKIHVCPGSAPKGAQAQLRVETFNLFNRVNLDNWDTNVANSTYGKGTCARDSRTIKLGERMVS